MGIWIRGHCEMAGRGYDETTTDDCLVADIAHQREGRVEEAPKQVASLRVEEGRDRSILMMAGLRVAPKFLRRSTT